MPVSAKLEEILCNGFFWRQVSSVYEKKTSILNGIFLFVDRNPWRVSKVRCLC